MTTGNGGFARMSVLILLVCAFSTAAGADLPEGPRGIAAHYPGDADSNKTPMYCSSRDSMRPTWLTSLGDGTRPTARRLCPSHPIPRRGAVIRHRS